jgi:hypothetical protein
MVGRLRNYVQKQLENFKRIAFCIIIKGIKDSQFFQMGGFIPRRGT